MEEAKSKICKMCQKEISSRARKCPYCHHWQNGILMVVFHPAFGVFMALISIAILYLFVGIMFKSMFDRGEDFAPYRNQIIISESELKFGEDKCGPTVVVMGKMANDSDISWKDIQLEVRFYDSNGKMVDTDQEKKYCFVIPANDVSTFKVSVSREFPEEQYGNFEVRVLSATDERTLW